MTGILDHLFMILIVLAGPTSGRDPVDDAISHRERAISACLEHLPGRATDIEAARLYYVLGELRADEACSVLAERIAFEAPTFRTDLPSPPGTPPWGKYPAAEALMKIGIASVPALVNNIEVSDARRTRELSAWALRSILHQALGESVTHDDGRVLARVIIERAAARQSDPEKRRRLESAADLYFRERSP